MFSEVRHLCLVVAFLVSGSAAAADWRVDVEPAGALYPVLELSQGHGAPPRSDSFGAGAGLVQIRLRANADAERVHVEIDGPYLTHPAQLDATLPQAGRDYVLRPSLPWDAPALEGLEQPQAAAWSIRVQRGDAPADVRDVASTVHPLAEALYYVRDGGERVDLSWIFAAYADPQDPVVAAILDQARARHADLDFAGYADGTARRGDVLAQAFALWEVLEDHGVVYADEDPGIARGPRVWSQRVRRHREVWQQRRANCLDGSLLLAAALERLGLQPFVLLVPRHALIGFYAQPNQRDPVFLETTLLGARHLAPRRAAFDPGPDPDAEALASFNAALDAGRTRYRREAASFGKHDPDYQWIDLATARAYGIIPLDGHAGAASTARSGG